MFKRLATLFRLEAEPQHQQPSANPTPSEAPDIVGARPTHAQTKDALQRFMHLVTAHLDSREGRRLSDAVATGFDSCGDAAEAFEDGVLGEEGQRHGRWLVIQVDWKAHEEIEWQVAEVATSFSIRERWNWTTPLETRTVPAGLCAVASWAAALGYELLHLDLGHDAYYALMVNGEDAEDAHQAAMAAGLSVLGTAEFARLNS
ncbi:DUF6630 family protein [Variovorax sp. IB41]|uniref:DUF6630 family protein n=1 Tax=Variovorax sp. IB41 TaxID=2779370 RepID=UPI0018E80D33|nr:hypothetical protein [Variovorax sp. IB41]MBJ2156641.1 hypothetical protein [Variovorax sp. IB41]